MSSRDIARQWFVPGDGIDRHVISADIQRYLGNDATVRPGKGTNEHDGIDGYWIKAYRNLTSAMVQDLRADSARWRQEQRATGTRGTSVPASSSSSGKTEPDIDIAEPYVGSSTYHQSSAAGARPARREGDSPRTHDHGTSGRERERIPISRMPVDSMDVDPPSRGSAYLAGGSTRSSYPHGDRPAFPSDRGYPPEPPSDRYGGRPSVSAPYGSSVPGYSIPAQNDGAPPGYVKRGEYYVPISHIEAPPASSRPDPRYATGYGDQPPYPPGRDPREAPRYPQPEYQDPARAYPSPAATVSSVPARERGPPSGNPQSYGGAPAVHYDVYGQPIQEPPRGSLPPPSRQSVRASVYMSDAADPRESRRRR